LYFIQKVAEFANDTDRDIIFIITLHQNFDAYTQKLNIAQRLEWEKVKGRFKEIAFAEPVEQLLFLAGSYLSGKGIDKIRDDSFDSLLSIIKESHTFPFNKVSIDEWAKMLYPLDLLSASIITLALQKYGQNERSLFTFLESGDETGIMNIDDLREIYYHIGCVYDYLIQNFYYYLFTKYNPDYLQWAAIRNSLERAEPFFKDDYFAAAKLIKTIGLLNIFASKAAKIDEAFLQKYSDKSLGIKNAEDIIEQLKKKKIIRYREFNKCFVLFEGTDLDIDAEIRKAGTSVELPKDITHTLKKYFHFPYLLARAIYFKLGTPRFFAFNLTMEPILAIPDGDVDGIINLIFNPDSENESVVNISKNCDEAILYAVYKEQNDIKNLLQEIEQIKHVLNLYPDDRVAQKELKTIRSYLINELNRQIMNNLYQSTYVDWIFMGEIQHIENKRQFNQLLSRICEKIYPYTPRFHNELINRYKLSGTISSARKIFFNHLVNFHHKKELGFPEHRYPPEKAIYLSLIKKTGIHREFEQAMILAEPTEPTFQQLWDVCEIFLYSTRKNKKSVTDLIEILSKKPFRLKNGFLEFWIPLYLFIKRDDYALFSDDIYVPDLNIETLQLLTRKPRKYSVKAFDIGGVKVELFNKYRIITEKETQSHFTNSLFVETIRPFLVFYRGLPEYTKRTKRLSKKSRALRDALASAKDPEKMFFEDLPQALGYSILLYPIQMRFWRPLSGNLKRVSENYETVLMIY
jgi:hypothetical protein